MLFRYDGVTRDRAVWVPQECREGATSVPSVSLMAPERLAWGSGGRLEGGQVSRASAVARVLVG